MTKDNELDQLQSQSILLPQSPAVSGAAVSVEDEDSMDVSDVPLTADAAAASSSDNGWSDYDGHDLQRKARRDRAVICCLFKFCT